jgi:pSer/pThr/pTyr-binding forkhead associated (FHA) protein
MKLSLVVLTPGPSEGKVIPIQRAQFVIGRDPGCQLRPASPHISNRHCALLKRDAKVFLRDLGSTNGTLVNDRQIKGEMELLNGDQLRVGPLLFGVCLEPVLVNQPTPVPPSQATTPKRTSDQPASAPAGPRDSAAGEAEDVATRLLSVQDSDCPAGSPRTEVPEGSTVFDLPASAEARQDMDQEKPKQSSGATSPAAKTIREENRERPRST